MAMAMVLMLVMAGAQARVTDAAGDLAMAGAAELATSMDWDKYWATTRALATHQELVTDLGVGEEMGLPPVLDIATDTATSKSPNTEFATDRPDLQSLRKIFLSVAAQDLSRYRPIG